MGKKGINFQLDQHKLPQLIAFDLDYTLWPFWVDVHISGPPFKLKETGEVSDGSGFIVKLYRDVASIMEFLRIYLPEVKLAIASRTPEPKWASEIITRLKISPDPAKVQAIANSLNLEPADSPCSSELRSFIDYFVSKQLYPGNKKPHFHAIRKETGIAFDQMIFFDDEPRNIKDVSGLGVHAVFVGDGLNIEEFLSSLKGFAER